MSAISWSFTSRLVRTIFLFFLGFSVKQRRLGAQLVLHFCVCMTAFEFGKPATNGCFRSKFHLTLSRPFLNFNGIFSHLSFITVVSTARQLQLKSALQSPWAIRITSIFLKSLDLLDNYER